MLVHRKVIGDNSVKGRRLRNRGFFSARLLLLVLCLQFPLLAQSNWHTEVVDGSAGVDVGKSASLAIDRQGNLHVAYYDDTHHSVRYAFRSVDDHRWFTMQVPGSQPAYPYLSLAVDSQGQPHISFVSGQSGLMYAHWDGKLWSTVQIDDIRAAYFNQIALDAADHPCITYYQEYSGSYRAPFSSAQYVETLKYAFFDGKQWYVQTVDRRFGSGKYNSLVMDPKGTAHIAYTRVTWWTLLYATGSGTQWHLAAVDIGKMYNHNVGQGNSIALDSSGSPHIAYFDVTTNTVRYASLQGGRWKLEIVGQLLGRAQLDHASLKIDSHNSPHIAFYDSGTATLKYAVKTGTKWEISVVDRDGAGTGPSLCLDAHDQPCIVYYDSAGHSLKFAYLQPGNSSVASAKRN